MRGVDCRGRDNLSRLTVGWIGAVKCTHDNCLLKIKCNIIISLHASNVEWGCNSRPVLFKNVSTSELTTCFFSGAISQKKPFLPCQPSLRVTFRKAEFKERLCRTEFCIIIIII